jgi:hypothetical protein
MTNRLFSVLAFVLAQLGCGGRSSLDVYTQSASAGNAANTVAAEQPGAQLHLAM